MAFHSAWKDVLSGQSELVLAMGVEKLFLPKAAKNPEMKKRMMKGFMNGVDNFDLPRLFAEYRRAAELADVPFETGTDRSFFMDTYAIQAALHMKRYGTTQRQIAVGAAKNHNYGAKNPLAQYRFTQTVDQVLEDREVSFPLTRAMCAPIGDGAASALLCSARYLERVPDEVRRRAVKVRASALTGGYYRKPEEPSLSHDAAKRAYAFAGLEPSDVDVAEIHAR
jgi:acetyl-CoA acetyltransferase